MKTLGVFAKLNLDIELNYDKIQTLSVFFKKPMPIFFLYKRLIPQNKETVTLNIKGNNRRGPHATC